MPWGLTIGLAVRWSMRFAGTADEMDPDMECNNVTSVTNSNLSA